MVTIWGLRGHQKSRAKDRDTGNIGQAESWRRSLSRKRWRWIPSATMRCFVKSPSFPVVVFGHWNTSSRTPLIQYVFLVNLGMFFLQHESNMNPTWIWSPAIRWICSKPGIERQLSWSAERMNWKIAWPGSFLKFCPTSEVIQKMSKSEVRSPAMPLCRSSH